ncbi:MULTISPECIES: YheC/YheD family endospore coat-associated protein [Brevibacillus]|uniref:YheC/YheD family endospore coat-associated protein n=1 Tax=Brevibacillus TaxID=55080 RepID=UPI000F090D61|nr:YheC/YheD family protein [Brevibacillus borstelensis]MCC0564964.1 YheC/YheD family protein [Brevibacillus borstelensis]MCM3469194.1 YheC/YheD family protein [Brevibacillus borstelensis]MCM3560083.1 YheC/YheD family protein [Brevibacillus borstelensis]MCM3589714.1 YheC/YheD family protein [Brevibacillus borstelensis]MCM3623473.1 YheC/YheD family protein [Brevibacillus borstelensis]
MSYVPVILQSYEPKTDTDLYLPQAHMRKWNLTPSSVTVQFGSKTARAKVSGLQQARNSLIRPSLAQMLHLPKGVPLLVRYQASQQRLVFGPYLGILVSAYNPQYSLSPFGGLTPFFNEVADSCRKRGGIVCIFRMQDVNWNTGIVRGMVRQNGQWRQVILPLPQCIYNRVVSRRRERSEAMSDWMQRCKEANIPFFNEQFLNKWHVHTALENEPGASEHLPRTILYQSKQDLESMLQSHKTVYAKPVNGSMGRGIVRIRRTGGGYQLSRSGGGSRQFGSISDLHRHLYQQTKGKKYLLQQGLSLIGIQQRPTDFRVLVQKDRQGAWGITSMVARLGQNRVVSNVSRGGSMAAPAYALRICGPWMTSARPTVQTLRSVALKLSQLLEQSLSGHYAELGIDLGVDVRGHVWLLEVNSKPSKTTNSLPMQGGEDGTSRRVRPSVLRMLDYSSYLSGFPRSGKSKSEARKKSRRG